MILKRGASPLLNSLRLSALVKLCRIPKIGVESVSNYAAPIKYLLAGFLFSGGELFVVEYVLARHHFFLISSSVKI